MTEDLLSTAKPTDIVAVVNANPIMVLTDEQKFEDFYEGIKRETSAHVPDLSTEKGRKEIASLAYKVAQTKTAIDKAGKELNEEARIQISAVDKQRKVIRDRLDALKDEVRKPLTDWEAAEDERNQKIDSWLEGMKSAATFDADLTAAVLQETLEHIKQSPLDEDLFQERLPTARLYQENTIAALEAAIERAKKAEADQAELERLRKEAVERDMAEQKRLADEQAERDAKAAKERQAREAKDAEERAQRAEKEAQEREQRAKQEAADAAAAEAKRAAQQEAEEREKQHQDELQAERDKAAALEAQQQAERDRLAKEEAAAKQRAADQEHRGKIKTAAKEALMNSAGVDEPTAVKIVLAILAKEIPHTTITF